jgi:hypothetical protein
MQLHPVSAIETEAQRAAGWFEGHLPGRASRGAETQTAARPRPSFIPSAQPNNQEAHVSIGAEFHRWASVAEKFGDQAIDILEAVASNPETLALVVAGARVAGLPLTSGTITGAVHSVQALEAAWNAGRQTASAAQSASGQSAQPAQTATGTPAAAPQAMAREVPVMAQPAQQGAGS